MISKATARFVAGLVVLIFGIALGSAIKPESVDRDPLATVVVSARTPLAVLEARLTQLAEPRGAESVPTIRAQHATAAAVVTAELAWVTQEAASLAALETAVITPTPGAPTATPVGPAPTQANVAGSGATLVPTARSGEVEVVLWGGPFDGWLPVIIVNGTDQPVVVEMVEFVIGGQRVGSGEYFAPALLEPGERSVGTLVTRYTGATSLTSDNFRVVTRVPTSADRVESITFVDPPRLGPDGRTISFSIRSLGQWDYQTLVVKGVCFDTEKKITGLFWESVGALNPQGTARYTGDMIGPGPCVDPLIGLGS